MQRDAGTEQVYGTLSRYDTQPQSQEVLLAFADTALYLLHSQPKSSRSIVRRALPTENEMTPNLWRHYAELRVSRENRVANASAEMGLKMTPVQPF